MIHTEVVLQSDRCECLRCGFYFHTFFRFDSLVQSVRVAAAFHDTSGLLVYNLHLSVDHNIFVIFLEHGVSLQQLVDGVYALRFDGVVSQQLIFLFQQLFVGQVLIFQFGELCGDIRQHEQCRVFGVTGDQVDTFICEVYAVQFFFDDEVQRFGHFVHTLVVLLHVDFFGLQHAGFDTLFTEELDQCLILRKTLVATIKGKESFFHFLLVVGGNQSFGFGKVFGCQYFLSFYQTFYQRTELFEQLVVALRHRTGNNQRSTGIVNQYRVNLIDDSVVVLALNKVFRADSHVVTQVVETEFIVGTERDVGKVCLTTGIGVRLMAVDAIYAQTVEHIKRAHPFGVTFGKVVVHGYYMHTVSGQRVQEYRKGSNESFTFTGCHFRNLTFVQNDTTEQLNVVMNHVPYRIIAAGIPVVLVDGLVAFNAYKVFGGSQMAVEFSRGYYDFFVFRKSFGSCFDDRESYGQYFFQCFLVFFENFFLYLIYLCKDFFAVFQFGAFDARFKFFHFSAFVSSRFADVFFEFFRFGTEGIVVQCFNLRVGSFDLFYPGFDFFHVSCGFVSENRA